ncbi:MAG: hypothetical protein M0Z51_17785 [Propionibacterium sp.]|nr:hypothetical protein [Propionibacterium sp.]
MTERTRRRTASRRGPRGTRANPAVLIIGVVFLLGAVLGLVYGLGHHLPGAVFRFGLPILLIAIGLLGLMLGRVPSASRRPARRRSSPLSPRG